MIEITNRWTGEVICTGETIAEAIKGNLACLSGANLSDANLSGAYLSAAYLRSANLRDANLSDAYLRDAYLNGAYLRGVNLKGANLNGAYLRDANLSDANLSGAYLSDANLKGANLRDANLKGANLSGANLSDAYLNGANLSWQSHDLLAEILKRVAGDDLAKIKVAGLVLICKERCWQDFLKLREPLMGWALGELSAWVKEGDGAPQCVVDAKKPGALEAAS